MGLTSDLVWSPSVLRWWKDLVWVGVFRVKRKAGRRDWGGDFDGGRYGEGRTPIHEKPSDGGYSSPRNMEQKSGYSQIFKD